MTNNMIHKIIISHIQVRPLRQIWDARAQSQEQVKCQVSPDLGLTTVTVTLTDVGTRFPNGTTLSWEQAKTICEAENNCFALENGNLHKIITFSDLTNRVYSLMPTPKAPTMLISGIPMHRIKGTEPHQDTLEKIKALRSVVGHVLDTATGLGYTAIEAAKTAEHVTTIELDPAALSIARYNPWSQALFDTPNITQCIGDSYDVIEDFEDEQFTRIIHDPPAFSLAGHLYSSDFYGELYRVLRRGGRLFHYIGDPNSKSGRTMTGSVTRRLQESGFARVIRKPRAFGVLALKAKQDNFKP